MSTLVDLVAVLWPHLSPAERIKWSKDLAKIEFGTEDDWPKMSLMLGKAANRE